MSQAFSLLGAYSIYNSGPQPVFPRQETEFPSAACAKMTAVNSIVIGIIAALVGFFLLLTSSRVLPNGITHYAIPGTGGTLFGLGLLAAICGAGLSCLYKSPAPIEPERFEQRVRYRFHNMTRTYNFAVEKLDKERSRNHLRNAWEELDLFAKEYPHFNLQVPENPFPLD